MPLSPGNTSRQARESLDPPRGPVSCANPRFRKSASAIPAPRVSRDFQPLCRRAAAMFFTPPSRSIPITRFRSAASSCGSDSVRTWLRFSPKTMSRTQCSRFSIPQCPRHIFSNRAASARSGGRLVVLQRPEVVPALLVQYRIQVFLPLKDPAVPWVTVQS